MSDRIRIVIADDHAIVRSSVAAWLRSIPDFDVVAEASDGTSAIDAAVTHVPDVLLLDVEMPGLECFEAVRVIRARVHQVRVLFVSVHASDRYIQEALAAGAAGYMTKAATLETLPLGIREVAAGRTFFSPEVAARLAKTGDVAHEARLNLLTDREVEVLRYIATGLSKKEIAGMMHLSIKTVDNHCTNLMGKLDIHDRVELARFAIREGIVQA